VLTCIAAACRRRGAKNTKYRRLNKFNKGSYPAGNSAGKNSRGKRYKINTTNTLFIYNPR